MPWRRGKHQGSIQTAGTVISIFVLREIPPLHASSFGVLCLAYGEWATFSGFMLYEGRQAGRHFFFFFFIEQKYIKPDH